MRKLYIISIIILSIATIAIAQDFTSKSILFTEKLDRTSPSILLNNGAVQELQNMKRPAPGIPLGWERRGGCTKYDTDQVANAEVKGLFVYQNSDHELERLYIQSNDVIYYSGETIPPAAGDITYTGIYTLDSGTSPLFGEKINDDMVFAGTGTSPFAYSGASAYPDGFLVDRETGATVYADGYDRVRDDRVDTYIIMPDDNLLASGESVFGYAGYRRRLNGMSLKFNNYNQVTSGITVQGRKNGSWVGVANLTDGTESGGKTFGQDGNISWDNDERYEPYILDHTKTHLYWYRFFTEYDVTDGVSCYQVKVSDEIESITNLWSGLWDIALGCLVSSSTGFVDYTGEVTDGTDINYVDIASFTGFQYLYAGFANPAQAVHVRIASGYENKDDNCHVRIYYWDAGDNDWVEISGATSDGTSGATTGSVPHISLYQTGTIQWDGNSIHEDTRSLGGLDTPLYWYRFKWYGHNGQVASLSNNSDGVRIWEIDQAEKPSSRPPFPHYDGVFEYNSRAMFWPGHRFRHGLDYCQDGYPYIMNGPRAGSTGDIFGPGIPNAAVRIASYAIVSTKDPYRLYLLQGKVPGRFDEYCISHHVGCVAPHTLVVIEDAIRVFSSAKIVHAGILLAPDGIYLVERTVVKISQPIDNYWDTSSTPYIQPEYAYKSYAWIDYKEKTVHFAVPINYENDSTPQTTLNREIIYSYVSDEWYDVYKRSSPFSSGKDMVGWNDERITVAGDYDGYIWKLDEGDTDNENIIEHYLKTGDILPLAGIREDVLNYSSTLRGIKVKSGATPTGTADIEVLLYPDGSRSGVTPTGTNTISMIDSDTFAMGKLNLNNKGESFAFRFRSGVSEEEKRVNMKLYGFTIDAQPLRETQTQ